ncbi:MAG: HEAT repeat domain-containing protein [Anaerolineae bacterium]|nr:HEAT repeat domain-containing protein [Anaerolineae bacterium]
MPVSDSSDVNSQTVESGWCLVANVHEFTRRGPNKAEIQRGTKHFSGGTKVYCFPPHWGEGENRIRVIGRHRGSRKPVVMYLSTWHLTNWRAKVVYDPQIVAMLKRQEHWIWGNEDAEARVKAFAEGMIERERLDEKLYDLSGMEPEMRGRRDCQAPGLGQEALLHHVKTVLRSEDRKVRHRALRVLQTLDVSEVVPMLIELMNTDPVDYIRRDSASALRHIGTPEALAAVEEWVKNRANV